MRLLILGLFCTLHDPLVMTRSQRQPECPSVHQHLRSHGISEPTKLIHDLRKMHVQVQRCSLRRSNTCRSSSGGGKIPIGFLVEELRVSMVVEGQNNCFFEPLEIWKTRACAQKSVTLGRDLPRPKNPRYHTRSVNPHIQSLKIFSSSSPHRCSSIIYPSRTS